MDFNDLFVEVLREDGAWYRALIHDFSQDGVEVHFPVTSLQPETVKYDKVRPIPIGEPADKKLEIGNDVEVQLLSKDHQPIGWVPGTIKDARGEFFVVDIKGSTTIDGESKNPNVSSSEIVPSDRIRSPNTQDILTPGCLFRYQVPLNENVEDLCNEANTKLLKDNLSPARLFHDKEARQLVVLTDNKACLNRSVMMIEMHLKCLDAKASLMRRTRTTQDRLRHSGAALSARYSCEFQLNESVMGLAIGAKGSNIQNARQIPGIVGIETDTETRMFRIFGETEEAIHRARTMLEFEERMIMIPRSIISRIIGKNGITIQDIVDRSQILRVKIEGDRDRTIDVDEDKVPLIFTGTVESINNAKILLDFYVAHIMEIDELARQFNKVSEELRKSMPQSQMSSKMYRVPYNQQQQQQPMSNEHLMAGNTGGMQHRGGPMMQGGRQQPVGMQQSRGQRQQMNYGVRYPRYDDRSGQRRPRFPAAHSAPRADRMAAAQQTTADA